MSDQTGSGGPTGSPGTGDGGMAESRGHGHARRAVMLGAAAAGAGAVASMALPVGAMASSEAVQRAGVIGPQPISVGVAVASNISLAEITDLVVRVGGLVGCRTCGLLGVDFRLFGVDPAAVTDIQSLETAKGVASAVILQQ